jgi:hypothetical protein
MLRAELKKEGAGEGQIIIEAEVKGDTSSLTMEWVFLTMHLLGMLDKEGEDDKLDITPEELFAIFDEFSKELLAEIKKEND